MEVHSHPGHGKAKLHAFKLSVETSMSTQGIGLTRQKQTLQFYATHTVQPSLRKHILTCATQLSSARAGVV